MVDREDLLKQLEDARVASERLAERSDAIADRFQERYEAAIEACSEGDQAACSAWFALKAYVPDERVAAKGWRKDAAMLQAAIDIIKQDWSARLDLNQRASMSEIDGNGQTSPRAEISGS